MQKLQKNWKMQVWHGERCKYKHENSGMKEKSKETCRNYVNTGKCKYGNNCWYEHKTICRYKVQGKCKKGDECIYMI